MAEARLPEAPPWPVGPTSARLGGALAIEVRRDGRLALPEKWPQRLRHGAQRISWGPRGQVLFAPDDIDWARDERSLVAVVGGLRNADGRFLSASELLTRSLATPDRIAADQIAGAGLVLAISTEEPKVTAYSTLISMHPLIWSARDGGLCAASEPRLLLPLLDEVEIDQRSVCSHLLFRSVPGELTYLQGMHRLYPGSHLSYCDGEVTVAQVRTLRDVVDGLPHFDRIDDASLSWLDDRMSTSTAAWVDQAWRRGTEVGNLLSGGLDSSLVQAWMIEERGQRAARSYSFAFKAPSFQFEVANAEQASQLTGSRHHAPQLDEDGYLELLERSIDVLAEPTVYNEAWPGHLALAEELARDPSSPRLLFSGFGADTLHGVSELQTVVRWQRLERAPRRRQVLLDHSARLRERPSGQNWLDVLAMRSDPRSLRDPHSYDALAGEVELLAPLFGDDALFTAFSSRRQVEQDVFASSDLHESMQVMDLLTAGYDPTLAVGRLYASAGIDVVQIYLDQQTMAAPFAFDPAIRFMRPRGPWSQRIKPLQQELLTRRGLAALVGRPKGGTNFNDEVWQWLTVGCLSDRVKAIDQPWLSAAALDEFSSAPSDVLWNVLTFDIFARHVVEPAAKVARGTWREEHALPLESPPLS